MYAINCVLYIRHQTQINYHNQSIALLIWRSGSLFKRSNEESADWTLICYFIAMASGCIHTYMGLVSTLYVVVLSEGMVV